MNIPFLSQEFWYGGVVHRGAQLPIGAEDDLTFDLVGGVGACDQYSPLFLSSKGRILHSDQPFCVHFDHGTIRIDDKFSVELLEGYETLKGAHQEAAKRYFQLGKHPDLKFFRTPQFNTWIELTYNQNQKDILCYAKTLLEGGMEGGVLMIDEGWAPDYGVYDFDARKFPDPKAMVDQLHDMGFSVMLWITPMISPDGDCFRSLRAGDLLLHDKDGKIAIREWWNGYSCILDFTNPKTCAYFREKLQYLTDTYGIDGFKFDAGDSYFYRATDRAYRMGQPNDHTAAFNRFCEDYTFNELRNVWNCGGEPLVCRLQDKLPVWGNDGLGTLLPNMLTQGILGYFYGCPDMVGGGSYSSFLEPGYRTDEELYLRWLAASVLCPMMQFSISPKRVLSEDAFAKVQKLVQLRQSMLPILLELVENAAKTGEPILRYLEYAYPGQGYETVTDQFLFGDRYLVAPILKQGMTQREVILPGGKWKCRSGEVIEGNRTVSLSADLSELILLEKIDEKTGS